MSNESTELVQRCLNGNDAAWEQLVEEYSGLVYSICHLSVMSVQDAEDLAQEAFIKIWKGLPSYDPNRGDLRAWIASLTRNLRIDRFRRSKGERTTDSMEEGGADQQLMDLRQSPHDSMLSIETREIIARKIEEISPAMRDVVKLHLLHELDKREIACHLHIPEGTVKSRVSRGVAQLASLLYTNRGALRCA
jgi:RNA polymerase sigma-70 factor (ECF subfamily)